MLLTCSFLCSLTSTNSHLSTTAIFFGGIHSLLFQLLYNGHLSTSATFFCPQGGRCRKVQLHFEMQNPYLNSACLILYSVCLLFQEKEGCHSTLYTLKWFMQCFLDRVSFCLFSIRSKGSM